MEQFKINIPEGMEIDMSKSDISTGNIFFKKKEVKLPTTNEECVNFITKDRDYYYITNRGEIDTCRKFYSNNLNFITTKEYAEAFLALMQLVKFRDIWNDGWIADWTDNSWKYTIYFYEGKKQKIRGRPQAGSAVLNFKTSEIRDEFSKQFNELIQIAKPLL